MSMETKIVSDKISLLELQQMAQEGFGDMVKAVVDVDKEIMAVGGELHADAEAVLLVYGSKQSDLWGLNIYPERGRDEMIVYTSLINIRPRQGNRSMEIEDQAIKEKVKLIILKLVS